MPQRSININSQDKSHYALGQEFIRQLFGTLTDLGVKEDP